MSKPKEVWLAIRPRRQWSDPNSVRLTTTLRRMDSRIKRASECQLIRLTFEGLTRKQAETQARELAQKILANPVLHLPRILKGHSRRSTPDAKAYHAEIGVLRRASLASPESQVVSRHLQEMGYPVEIRIGKLISIELEAKKAEGTERKLRQLLTNDQYGKITNQMLDELMFIMLRPIKKSGQT